MSSRFRPVVLRRFSTTVGYRSRTSEPRTKHAAFQMNNLDEFLVAICAKGADVAVVERNTGLGPMCFLRDPSGTLDESIEAI